MSVVQPRIRFAFFGFLVACSAVVGITASAGPAAAGAAQFCGGIEATIVGTAGADELTGTAGRDIIKGLGGNDVINGLGGRDVICGDGGNDIIYGNEGADRLYGGLGNDDLWGGKGNDRLYGKKGRDALHGLAGADLLIAGKGNDKLVGGFGNDTLRGERGADRLHGDSANANAGNAGVDELLGGYGNDELFSRWDLGDADGSGPLSGGGGFDTCVDGNSQNGCEWDGVTTDPEVWRPLVRQVFKRWGLDTQTCSTAGGPQHCVGGQVNNAVAVLACESAGDPSAVNSSSGTTGLFQHQLGVFWSDRVARVQNNHSDKEPGFPSNASALDPEHNIIMAALLVWESKDTQLNLERRGGISPSVYPEFNFAKYNQKGYGYSNWGEGPEPWGHWVGCASTGAPHNGLGLYDAAWIHPWADTQWP